MPQTKALLEVHVITDSDTSYDHIGDVEFSIHCKELEQFLSVYGFEGRSKILAMLGHLAYQTEVYFRESQPPESAQATPPRTPADE